MQVYCKMENLQRTGSFKERGARNALLTLSPDAQQRGVIAASAGNHALGLSCHGQLLNVPVTVVMPRFAPLTKVTNCRRFGADVVLHGNTFAEALKRADGIGAEKGLTYINGFDDLPIIAGQGTLGIEIIEQVPDVEAVIVPVGGGGLIAGMATAIRQLRPGVTIIGVEPERCASFTAAIKAGGPTAVDPRPTLADGLAVAKVGPNAFESARPLVDKVLLVNEQQIALAILRLLELEKSVVEGAGAAGLAACLAGLVPHLKGKKVVLPLCGGNIDSSTLGRILERGLAHDGRLCRLTVTISDRPGGLARFASIIGEEGGSIVEIDHDRAFASDDITTVVVHCVIETRDQEHISAIKQRLTGDGFPHE
jgi:threonine dehydratase